MIDQGHLPSIIFWGPPGVGKTTIARLISRFYDVTAGSVKVGGVDVREQTTKQLMASLSLAIVVVILTHLHLDHASGIAEFPDATFIVTAAEWKAATTGATPARRGRNTQGAPEAREGRLDSPSRPPAGPGAEGPRTRGGGASSGRGELAHPVVADGAAVGRRGLDPGGLVARSAFLGRAQDPVRLHVGECGRSGDRPGRHAGQVGREAPRQAGGEPDAVGGTAIQVHGYQDVRVTHGRLPKPPSPAEGQSGSARLRRP